MAFHMNQLFLSLCASLVCASTLFACAEEEAFSLAKDRLLPTHVSTAKMFDADFARIFENAAQPLPPLRDMLAFLTYISQMALQNGVSQERLATIESLTFELTRRDIPAHAVIPTLHVSNTLELDPGFGFHTLGALGQLYLEELHRRAHASDRVVKTADVGAGFGWMAGLSLVSGGLFASAPKVGGHLRGVHVTAFENHPLLLGDKAKPGPVMQFFKQAKEASVVFKGSGARACDYSAVVTKDAVVALGEPHRANTFECAYLGSMIHYLSPKRADLMTQNLMHALQPGGRVFASAHTGLHFPDIEKLLTAAYTAFKTMGIGVENDRLETPFKIYQKQIDSGALFPGWMVLTMAQHYDTDGGHIGSDFTSAQILDETCDTLSPVERHAGAYKCDVPISTRHASGVLTQRSHRSYQIYDSVSFGDLFKRAGFILEDLFYTDEYGQRAEIDAVGAGGRFTDIAQTQTYTRVCVVARKPS